MSRARNDDDQSEAARTRERLLDAAEQLFSEQGYEATSVREITAAAGCNVAAVNYHFGAKQRLYEAVFSRLLRELREWRIERVRAVLEAAGDEASLELFIESFASTFLEPLGGGGRGWRLMAFVDRELHHHNVPAEIFFAELIRPVSEFALEVLARVVPEIDETTATMCLMSLVGQLIHSLKVLQMVGERGAPPAIPTDLESHVEHVVRYAAGGIRACARADARRDSPQGRRG